MTPALARGAAVGLALVGALCWAPVCVAAALLMF